MTTRWPRPVVAVLCTLLAVATPAAAACAWVAWQGGISEIDMHATQQHVPLQEIRYPGLLRADSGQAVPSHTP
jgi:hypothetical protein